MKKLLFIFLLTLTYRAFPQTKALPQPVFTKNLSDDYVDFSVDNLGNIYLISNSGQVKKLNNQGDSVSVFNDIKRYGQLYSLDVSNPFKIILFYKDYSTIIILDRLLNVLNTIDFRQLNFYQITSVATSYDSNIWLYDEQDSRIKKIDNSGNILLQSAELRQALNTVPAPVSMFDRDGHLYMYDTSKGLFIFDYYGALKNDLIVPHLQDLQVIDKNTITAHDHIQFTIYKPATLQTINFTPFSLNRYSKLLFNSQYIYCFARTSLEVYKFNP